MDWTYNKNIAKWAKAFSDIAESIPNMSARMLTERFKELGV